MESLLKTQDVMKFFNVNSERTIAKFRRQGLRYIPIGNKDYRYSQKDIIEFAEHLKDTTQQIKTKRKYESKTIKEIDLEKRRINLELNKVF